MSEAKLTPAMQQYHRFKQRHSDCVLLFRIGDFYEMFGEDAVKVSKAIGLTLTQRTEGVPMAGVPFHQLDVYLKKLIAAGFRVAVAEQLVEASQAKGVVPRAVTRVLTPGTLVDDSLLDPDSGGAVAAVAFTGEGDASPAALAVVEVSTGDFAVLSCAATEILDELARRRVLELLYCDTGAGVPARVATLLASLRISGTPLPAWHFRPEEARQSLVDHFGVSTLRGFGLADDAPEVLPAGAALRYVLQTQTLDAQDARTAPKGFLRPTLAHLRPPRLEDHGAHCVIDAVSLRALEIERTVRGGEGSNGSLLGIFIGHGRSGITRTPMGRRLLRGWLCRPLRSRDAIEARQRRVSTLVEDRELADELGSLLGQIQDVPRIAARLALARVTPRDLVGLARSLAGAEELAACVSGAAALDSLAGELQDVAARASAAAAEVLRSCVESPPPHLREGGLVRDGVDPALDEARLLQRDAGAWLADYQKRLIETHQLPGLKVGYNRVFGYYIELPQAQARQAPDLLQRKQTLRNSERYTTPELSQYEQRVLTAQSRALERERELFAGMCASLAELQTEIALFAGTVAELDAALGFANKAAERGWVRPEIADEPVLVIHGGRHPVLDELLQGTFVANDVELGASFAAESLPPLALITGPNMAGKSTFIRQTALISLLALAGSFVPADRARVGLIDRIFTRIGADDALHAGQSTFMVEMIETANILNHATGRSLVVLDEVGRGTSTLDGLSLAWAIAEHLAHPVGADHGPRTLFATHYHELTELEGRFPERVRNLHVAVREWPGGGEHAEIVFLHRILPGRTDQSYGVHVARLAGVPAPVVRRAREILKTLAVHHSGQLAGGPEVPAASRHDGNGQLPLFTEYLPHPVVNQLAELKLDALTPLQAFDELRKLRAQAVQPDSR
ncbi:MAG: DNA mismatch repair protein MutS [Phycisphaerales bacterium]|nr:DNA mismatch repair protein MutS [Phycisphaerales bacterium]